RNSANGEAIHVQRLQHDVKVSGTTVARGPGGAAIVVELENKGSKPVNDLPIAVGVRGPNDSGVRYLNLKGGDYFQSHTPAIAPGKRVSWVYLPKGKLPPGSPTARVGAPAKDAPKPSGDLPELDVSHVRLAKGKGGATTATAEVASPTGTTQYKL